MNKPHGFLKIAAAAVVALGAQTAAAQPRPEYGTSINLADAKKIAAKALAECITNKWNVAVAIVDTHGGLVYFERLDNTQTGSIGVAQDKAVSAAMFRRPTKVFQDALAGGGAGLRILSLRGASAVEGGIPLAVDGRIVGAIGVSGGSSEQDGVIAKAGVEAMAK